MSAVKCNETLACCSASPQEHVFGITEMITVLEIDYKILFMAVEQRELFRFT